MAAVQLPNVSNVEFEASLTELRELAMTLDYKVANTFVQKRSSFDATAYLGAGKREEIRCFIDNEAESTELEKIAARPDSQTPSWSTMRFHHRRRATLKMRSAAK